MSLSLRLQSLITIVVCCNSLTLFAAPNALIKDLRKLRNSVTASDPVRLDLTLRLADVLADEANITPTAEGQTFRREAALLYEESLTGNNKAYKPVSGKAQYKVKFQLAKIYSDLGDKTRALPLWKELASQKEFGNIEREAYFRLAEEEEAGNSPQNLAKAEEYYSKAFSVCLGSDLCSYAMYRRAWVARRQGRIADATDLMRKALYDSKNQIREESLRDLLAFLALDPKNVDSAIAEMEKRSAELSKPLLVAQLADAYLAAGHRKEAARALALVNQRNPDASYQIRLLEEYVGQKDWTHADEMLVQLETSATPAADLTVTAEREKMLKRIAVQYDGERQMTPERTSDFRRVVALYLKVIPESPDRLKMMEGWMAAESNDKNRLSQVATWMAAPWKLSVEEEKRLRGWRFASGEKTGETESLLPELARLSELEKNDTEKRRLTFAQAALLNKLKRQDEALVLFDKLAAGPTMDEWGVRARCVALDVLAEKKNYDALIGKAEAWASTPLEASLPKQCHSCIGKIPSILKEAKFELAVSQGQTPKALAIFLNYCHENILTPQSCENAKSLAVTLNDRTALFDVLKTQRDWANLSNEYEASGYFAEAAELKEQGQKGKPSTEEAVRLALLYELGGKNAERNRVLRQLMTDNAITGFGEYEELVFLSAKDAGILKASDTELSWKPQNRARVASFLAERGEVTPRIQKILFDQKESAGKGWSKLILAEAERLDKDQQKYTFHGKRSEVRFELRVKGLKTLSAFIDKYLAGADAETQSRLATIAMRSNADLAKEVLATPIPGQTPQEVIPQIQASLQEMAAPFDEKAKAYEKLVASEPAPVVATAPTTVPAPAAATPGAIAAAPIVDPKVAIATLHQHVNHHDALKQLRDFYDSNDKKRLAAYFEGRLKGAAPMAKEPAQEGVIQ